MFKMCCVDGCVSTSDVTFFRFPNSRTLKKRWLDAITPKVADVTDSSVICNQHFLKDQYEVFRGKTRLKSKVVPSIFSTTKSTNDTCQIPPEVSERLENIPPTNTPSIDNDVNTCGEHPGDRLDNHVSSVPNGEQEDTQSFPQSNDDPLEPSKDLEDMITNYHIKQIRPVEVSPYEIGRDTAERDRASENIIEVSIDVSREIEQDLIEIDVDKGSSDPNQSQECLMLLENVQVEVDPNLLFPELQEDERTSIADSDIIELEDKKEDPISLLTSSDEDDVILQEPKIDTVDVSSETDEDDMPLVKLIKEKKSKNSKISEIFWGKYEYYCVECQYTTRKKSEFRKHVDNHSTIMQMCKTCDYTTPSKYQFSRHLKKHRYEKKYKCHLCEYSAKHRMSLTYHMKTHELCRKCYGKSKTCKHVKRKSLACELCVYRTSRPTDLRRHQANVHRSDENVTPQWT